MYPLDLSISIVSYNDKEFLKGFLSSIYNSTIGVSFEVLVVNNGNQDGVVEMIRDEFPKVDLIVNNKNQYFTYATNQNLVRAKGEFIVYLSSDTLVSDNSFGPMIELMRKDPLIGVVGPIIYDFEGHIHSPGQMFPTFLSSILELIGFHRRFPQNNIWLHRHYRDKNAFESFDVDTVSGACLMTKREVINRVGLLDQNLIMFYDEHDFCRRVRMQKYRVVHCGDAQIKHYGQGISKKEPPKLIMSLMQDSFLYLHRKYYGFLTYIALRAIAYLIDKFVSIKRFGKIFFAKRFNQIWGSIDK
jgi:GT2 family glycosyltransferase